MDSSNGPLTLEGLARILRQHMDATTARFAEVGDQFATVRTSFDEVGRRIDDLRGEVGVVATVVRDLAQIVARHHDENAEERRAMDEHRRELRQIYTRMEQHDARMAEHDSRFEAMARDIRQILDAMERGGGDGGRRMA
jgi:chromosome segregation ATPase